MAERDVLIVDDDRQVREVLHQAFVAAGYNCLLANDGREGVEVFKAGRPPLVVTDLKMPGITGIELLQQARAVDGDVAVIVLTDPAANWKNAIESLRLGAHAFLMKPINVDELLITVERALERRQLLIERRERQQAYEQLEDIDRTTPGRANMPQRDVLIVENHPEVRDVFHQIFLAAGYKCLAANDGRQGLEVFRGSRPSLIVTNLIMPVMSGLELLKQVRQEDRDAAIIAVSVVASAKAAIACLKLGAYAFLRKPMDMDVLLITAERALERRQLLIERRQRHERG